MYRSVYPPQNILLRILRTGLLKLRLRSVYFGHVLVMKKKIEDVSPLKSPEGVEFVEAGEKDIQSIIDHPESQGAAKYFKRLSDGHTCYCVKRDGKILGYQWIAYDSCCVNFATSREFVFFPLKKGQAFLYDIFVFRKFRRIGVASFLAKKTVVELGKKGIVELFVLVSVGNIPSSALMLINGFEPVRVIYYYGFKKVKKMFFGIKNSGRMKEWKEYLMNKSGLIKE